MRKVVKVETFKGLDLYIDPHRVVADKNSVLGIVTENGANDPESDQEALTVEKGVHSGQRMESTTDFNVSRMNLDEKE